MLETAALSLQDVEEQIKAIRSRILAIHPSFPPFVRAGGPVESGRGKTVSLDLGAAKTETSHSLCQNGNFALRTSGDVSSVDPSQLAAPRES